jgi:hypothetical protein
MSAVFTAAQVASTALRAIGSFPITESAPDGEHLREAMTWLDMLLAEKAGTMRIFQRVPATLSFPIVNGTQAYNLYTALGSQLPADRIQFVIDAWMQDQSGTRYPIEIVNRQKFETVDLPSETGMPEWIYIDRQQPPQVASPTLQIFPTPDVADPTVYTLFLEVQQYAPTVAPGGVTGTQPQSAVLHAFGVAWQRWMVFQLAHDLGSGPIVKIGEASLTRFEKTATAAMAKLEAFENREQETTPPIGEPAFWNDDDCAYDRRCSTDYGNRPGWR